MDALKKNWLKYVALAIVPFLIPSIVFAQAQNAGNLNLPGMAINFGQGANLVDSIEILLLFTVLSLAPSILILCTSFTRILVVLSFMRQAIGTQNMPPNQLLIGFALFLSVFVMQPTGVRIYDNAIKPYMNKEISTTVAIDEIVLGLRGFMENKFVKQISLFFMMSQQLKLLIP